MWMSSSPPVTIEVAVVADEDLEDAVGLAGHRVILEDFGHLAHLIQEAGHFKLLMQESLGRTHLAESFVMYLTSHGSIFKSLIVLFGKSRYLPTEIDFIFPREAPGLLPRIGK
jgi:hypothetical protein